VEHRKHTGLNLHTLAKRPDNKSFQNTRIKVAYSTKNTPEKLLTKQHHPLKDKYEKSGIYQLTCPTCNMKYMGLQTWK
jgi:hypothetical protein